MRYSVKVAQQPLTLLVGVRIPVSQPKTDIPKRVCPFFFRLRYGDLRTPLSRSERGSSKQPQRRAAAADCVVSSTRDFSPNARSVRKMRERRVPLYSKNFIKANGHTQTGVSVFFRLRYRDLRTPLSRSERGSSKRRKNEIFPRGVGSERFFREPQQRSKKSEAYRTPVSQP